MYCYNCTTYIELNLLCSYIRKEKKLLCPNCKLDLEDTWKVLKFLSENTIASPFYKKNLEEFLLLHEYFINKFGEK